MACPGPAVRAIHQPTRRDGDDHDDTPTAVTRLACSAASTRTRTSTSPPRSTSSAGCSAPDRSRRRRPAIGSCGSGCAAGARSSPSASRGPGRGVPAWPVTSPPQGVDVREVMRPNRQHRRRYGKSDEADAIGAARAVLAGEAVGTPKAGTGQVEAIRLLRIARRSAMKARTQAGNQIHAVIDTAPEQLRRRFVGRPTDDDRRRGGPVPSPPRPDHSARGGPAHAAHAGSPLGVPRRRTRRARRPARRAHRRHRTDAAGDQRCRRPSRHRRARRRRRQPRPAALIGVVRRAVRRVTDRRLLRPSTTPPAQPLRRPPRQLGAARRSSSAGSAGTPRPRPTWPDDSPKDAPTRWSCAASNDTSSARSTAPSPPTSASNDTLDEATTNRCLTSKEASARWRSRPVRKPRLPGRERFSRGTA